MALESMAKIINDYSVVAEKRFRDKDISSGTIELISDMANMLKFEIHEYLSVLHTPEAETKIRDYVKFCNSTLLPLIVMKIDELNAKISKLGNMRYGLAQIPEEMKEEVGRCTEIRDNVYALICCRSLKHFALFMEEDKPLDEQDWHNAGSLFDGLWYHANRMILDGTVQFIQKLMFTGAGKSYSDIVMIAFIFGQSIDYDVIKVFGNKVNVAPCMNSLVDYMTLRRYAKVFPYFEQFSCSEEMMFETCKKTTGQLKIKGSKRPMNILVVSKDTNISGPRATFLFLDDITQEADAGNMRMHEKDIKSFENVWKKRYYYQNKFRVVVGGTCYSVNDILAYLRSKFSGSVKSKGEHKYTTVERCDVFREDGEAVFIKIPKLDYVTDISTFPHKYPTNQARAERTSNPIAFEAMDQQNPLPPEGTPFAYSKLKQYDEIPHNRDSVECCWACIDPARTGDNYVTMLILQKVNIEGSDKYFFKDCVYEMRPMKDMYPFFVEKIIQHRITKLHIERNTDTSLKALVNVLLTKEKVTYCDISEIYTVKVKGEKIYNMEAAILNNIIFPREGMYPITSQMGTAMKHITTYSYKNKNDYDDAPDTLAMFCEKFVLSERILPKVQVLDIRRRK